MVFFLIYLILGRLGKDDKINQYDTLEIIMKLHESIFLPKITDST